MRRLFAALMVLSLAAFVGCNRGTEGGPGASDTHSKTSLGQHDDTFSLSVSNTTLKQGESKAVTIGIKRGKNFDQDVALKFDNMPDGVSVDPASPMIKKGDEEAKVTFKAKDDAAVGKFDVKVMGHPAKGSDAANELKLTVEKK